MSDFSGEGFPSFPSLYQDNQRLGEVSGWSNELLDARAQQYARFLNTPDLMPRARQQAERFLSHVVFEIGYRDGVYAPTETDRQTV